MSRMIKRQGNTANSISFGGNLGLNALFVVLSLCAVIPIVLVIIVSLTDEGALINHGYSFFPEKFSTDAYKIAFADMGSLMRAYAITIYATVGSTIVCLLVTSMYSYVISRKDFLYKNQLAFFAFFTMLFSGGLVPWYIMYTQYLHLKDTLLVYIVPTIFSAYNMLIMRTYFKTNISESIIESAKIDGAGEAKIFFTIVVPLAKPVFATIGLFNSLYVWNDWYTALLFIDNDKLFNLQYMMYKVLLNIQNLQRNAALVPNAAEQFMNMPGETLRMAMAIIGIGPIVFAYPFFQKYFIKGLTLGAVKG